MYNKHLSLRLRISLKTIFKKKTGKMFKALKDKAF